VGARTWNRFVYPAGAHFASPAAPWCSYFWPLQKALLQRMFTGSVKTHGPEHHKVQHLYTCLQGLLESINTCQHSVWFPQDRHLSLENWCYSIRETYAMWKFWGKGSCKKSKPSKLDQKRSKNIWMIRESRFGKLQSRKIMTVNVLVRRKGAFLRDQMLVVKQ